MKTFSPAGMAVKGYYGGPGWPFGGDAAGGGRNGWQGAQTFGNPDGATSGGGAYGKGGANPNGPGQGGFLPGGGQHFSGIFTLNATALTGFVFGYADGFFAGDGMLLGGTVVPNNIPPGQRIGAIWQQTFPFNNLYFGVYGTHLQSDFTTLEFYDQFGTLQQFTSAGVNSFQQVTQTSPPAPNANGGEWRWNTPGAVQYFLSGHAYTIYVGVPAPPPPPLSFTVNGGIASTGPLPSPYGGDGTGYYQGTLNGGFGCGSTVPASVVVFGSNLIVCGWGGSAPYPAPGFFCVCLQGTLPRNFFSQVNLGAPYSVGFTTAASQDYTTTDFPGYTAWTWSSPDEFSHIGASFTVTVFP